MTSGCKHSRGIVTAHALVAATRRRWLDRYDSIRRMFLTDLSLDVRMFFEPDVPEPADFPCGFRLTDGEPLLRIANYPAVLPGGPAQVFDTRV